MEKTDFAEQREDLLQSIERDQEEVRVAVQELTGAARSKLNVSEHIKEFPLTWAIGAFLVGAWLGSRGAPLNASRTKEIMMTTDQIAEERPLPRGAEQVQPDIAALRSKVTELEQQARTLIRQRPVVAVLAAAGARLSGCPSRLSWKEVSTMSDAGNGRGAMRRARPSGSLKIPAPSGTTVAKSSTTPKPLPRPCGTRPMACNATSQRRWSSDRSAPWAWPLGLGTFWVEASVRG